MPRRISLPAVFALFLCAYAASPYLAMWQLAAALRSGDPNTLERAVDWASVRAGLKQDIAEGLIGEPQAIASGKELPAFGASFVSGIAGSEVDRELTPQHVMQTARELQPATAPGGAQAGLRWAFFDSPTSFVVSLRCPGQEADDAPLKLRMELRRGRWQVTRVWVPQDLMDEASTRT